MTVYPQVLHLTSVHYLFDTRIFEKECVSLAERGWRMELVGPATDAVNVGTVCCAEVTTRAVELPKSRLFRVLASWLRLAPIAFSKRFSLVHVHDPELLPLAVMLRLFGKVVVFDMHEDIPRQILQKHWLPGWSRRLLSKCYRLLERLTLRGLPVIYAEDSYPESRPYVRRSQLVRNFPSIQRVAGCRSGERHPIFTAVYVGDVTEARGVRTMCTAVEALNENGVRIELEIIGRCSDGVAKALARQYAEAGHVRFLGRLPYEEAMRRASRAHVGLSLLMPLPNYAHSLPTKVLEYFLLGLPVIGSSGTLGGKIVSDAGGGFVIDAMDASGLERLLVELMEAPGLRDSKARSGEHYTRERFDWEKEADALDGFYRRLLGLCEPASQR